MVLSKILIEKYNGEVPQSFDGLEELPAVGHKTASVVMSQAFGVPCFSCGHTYSSTTISLGFYERKKCGSNRERCQTLVPKELWNDLHLQIIWYGREYSPARGWNLENDIITKTIGRKAVLEDYHKKQIEHKKSLNFR